MENEEEMKYGYKNEDESERVSNETPKAVKSLGSLILISGLVWLLISFVILLSVIFGYEELKSLFKDDIYMVLLFGFAAFICMGLTSISTSASLKKSKKGALSLSVAVSLMGIGIGLVLLTLEELMLIGVVALVAYILLLFYLILSPTMKRNFPYISSNHVRTASQFSFLFLLNATIIGSLIVGPLLPILRFRHMAGGTYGVPLCSVGSLARCLSGNWWGLFVPVAVLGVLMLIGLFFGRAMCGWACPIGFIQDLVTKIRTRLHLNSKEMSQENHERLTTLKYAILFLFLLLALSIGISSLGHHEAGEMYKSQFSDFPLIEAGSTPCETCPGPIIGNFMPDDVITHGFEGTFVLTTEATVRLSVFFVFVIGVIMMGRFYCRYLCPSGAMISFFNKGSLLSIRKDQDKCTKCNLCVTACPMRVKRLKDEDVDYEIRDRECTFCLDCIDACPEKALALKFHNKDIYKGGKEWWEKVT